MDEVLDTSDVLGWIRTYIEDVDGVLYLLYDVYPVVTHKRIKTRRRKVQRRIKNVLSWKKVVARGNPGQIDTDRTDIDLSGLYIKNK